MPDSRVALVTGAAQGLGLGIARALAAAGYRIVIADREDCPTEAVAVADMAMVCDVSDRGAVDATIAAIGPRFGRLDVVVNNAQTTRSGPVLDVSTTDAELVWRSGFLGTLNVMQAAYPLLAESGGSIVNVASGAGLSAPAGYGIYAATKEAIRTITRVTALEWGPDGIRVNAISPAARTDAFDVWEAAHPEEAARRVASVPLRRMGDPETDIGAAVVFLAGDGGSYITGSTLVVDGGAHHLR